jgi:hypothetical protein
MRETHGALGKLAQCQDVIKFEDAAFRRAAKNALALITKA